MKKWIIIAILILPVLATAKVSYNTLGYREYKKGNFHLAYKYFKKATKLNPSNPLAPYNLACVMCIMRTKGKTCEYKAYVPNILNLLNRSIKLDYKRKRRILEDKDLIPIHSTVFYHLIKGYRYNTDSGLKRLLPNIKWSGLRYGEMGVVGNIRFTDGNRFEFDLGGYMDFVAEKSGREAEYLYISRGRGRGTYTVEHSKIILSYTDNNGIEKSTALSFNFDGTSAMISGGEAEKSFLFYDYPDECNETSIHKQ